MIYTFENLEKVPDQQRIKFALERSELSFDTIQDISFHPYEKWLKVWFENELTQDQELFLQDVVDESISSGVFELVSGNEYFELITGDGRWKRVIHKVKFGYSFASIPVVEISNAVFDGATNMNIIGVTNTSFIFSVQSTREKGRNGVVSIQFDWIAHT